MQDSNTSSNDVNESAVTQTKSALAPHCRGYCLVRTKPLSKTELDRSSKRVMSIPLTSKRQLVVTLVFVYAAHANMRVVIREEGTVKRVLPRIFVLSRFPYLSLRPVKHGYKSLNFGASLLRITAPHTISIDDDESGSNYTICAISPVGANEVMTDLKAIVSAIDAEVSQGDACNLRQLPVLERSLLNIPKEQRGTTWQQALITLYAFYQVNHKVAFHTLEDLVNHEKAAKRTDALALFQEKLQRICAPNALGRHGYNPSLRNADLEQVENDLKTLLDELTALGARPFLNSGTLLGYYRDGKPIPHDDDFDIGILLAGETPEDVAREWQVLRKKFAQHPQIVDKGTFFMVVLPSGLQVDLFAAWINDGKLYVDPYCFGDVDGAALEPLRQMTVRGTTFPVPNDPDRILAVNYGPNWRIPDPFWKFDFTAAHRRFGTMRKLLKS